MPADFANGYESTVTDEAGNVSTLKRTVTVSAPVAPVIEDLQIQTQPQAPAAADASDDKEGDILGLDWYWWLVIVAAAAPVSSGGTNPVGYFATALQSLSSVAVMSLGMLALVAIVGAVAHHYRKKFPKAIQQNWRKHQGIYTFFGMIGLGIVVILASGGGSI